MRCGIETHSFRESVVLQITLFLETWLVCFHTEKDDLLEFSNMTMDLLFQNALTVVTFPNEEEGDGRVQASKTSFLSG